MKLLVVTLLMPMFSVGLGEGASEYCYGQLLTACGPHSSIFYLSVVYVSLAKRSVGCWLDCFQSLIFPHGPDKKAPRSNATAPFCNSVPAAESNETPALVRTYISRKVEMSGVSESRHPTWVSHTGSGHFRGIVLLEAGSQ